MSTLKAHTVVLPSARLRGVNPLPPIADLVNPYAVSRASRPDEDDGLFLRFDGFPGCFPYLFQDRFDRAELPTEYPAVTLENENLRALFLPTLGGKLWSLYDKRAGRELLFRNPVVRPGNLALRAAWTSGGVEWNCGTRGHGAFTCDRVFTAETALADGTPVLRIYEYERILGAVWQIDFYLPDGARMLRARCRVVNPRFESVPLYWWSNAAVPRVPGSRTVVGADAAYVASEPDRAVTKISVPFSDGFDVTYPERTPVAFDYFWKTPREAKKFMCQIGPDGYGLGQISTSRQKGRKLFVWGDSAGGRRWQAFLSGGGSDGGYDEIQAGIAFSQYEAEPMPPLTAWEWIEAYGPVLADPARIHGDWNEAKAEALARVEEGAAADELERELRETRGMATSPARTLMTGSGWGALEKERRRTQGEPEMCPHLDFGKTEDEQRPWIRLLVSGTLGTLSPDAFPASHMRQSEWTELLERAAEGRDADNWYALAELALIRLSEGRDKEAESLLGRAEAAGPSATAAFARAVLCRKRGAHGEALNFMREAYRRAAEREDLSKELMQCCMRAEDYAAAVRTYEEFPPAFREIPRNRMYCARALAELGKPDRAAELLEGLEVPDIREGENSVTALWYAIRRAECRLAGRVFREDENPPPPALDFRMFAK